MPSFTLEYWLDEDWYVGRIKELPGVFSQGETLAELKENLREACQLLQEGEEPPTEASIQTDEIQVWQAAENYGPACRAAAIASAAR